MNGHFRESNPGPLAPKARIIPLDQSAKVRRPGLEPGSPAWKADMLTPTPQAPVLSPFIYNDQILFLTESLKWTILLLPEGLEPTTSGS